MLPSVQGNAPASPASPLPLPNLDRFQMAVVYSIVLIAEHSVMSIRTIPNRGVSMLFLVMSPYLSLETALLTSFVHFFIHVHVSRILKEFCVSCRDHLPIVARVVFLL